MWRNNILAVFVFMNRVGFRRLNRLKFLFDVVIQNIFLYKLVKSSHIIIICAISNQLFIFSLLTWLYKLGSDVIKLNCYLMEMQLTREIKT